jgi:hypothetical protein
VDIPGLSLKAAAKNLCFSVLYKTPYLKREDFIGGILKK